MELPFLNRKYQIATIISIRPSNFNGSMLILGYKKKEMNSKEQVRKMEKRQIKMLMVPAVLVISIIIVAGLTTPLSLKAKTSFSLLDDLPLELYDIVFAGEAGEEDVEFPITAPIYNDLWGHVLVIEFKVKNLDTVNNYSTNVNVRVRHPAVDLNATFGNYANITGNAEEYNASDDTLMGYGAGVIGDGAYGVDGAVDSLSPTGYTLGLDEKEDTVRDFFEKDALHTNVELVAGENYLYIKIYIKIKIDFGNAMWTDPDPDVDQSNWKIRIWVHGTLA